MEYLTNTQQLVSDGIITSQQATEIETRSREKMANLAINTILIAGIVTATLGLIAFLASPIAVAIAGLGALALGLILQLRGNENIAIFTNASMLIGAGLLLGGGSFELVAQLEAGAAPFLLFLGAAVGIGFLWAFHFGCLGAPFVTGAITLMGASMFVGGLYLAEPILNAPWVGQSIVAALAIGLGIKLDVRFITALAIIPLAQLLENGTGYWHAVYVFWAPETTLSILQMALICGICFWLASRTDERYARHFGTLMILSFVMINMNFWVGSLWTDYVGEGVWGPGHWRNNSFADWEAFNSARADFRATAWVITDKMAALLWAIFLTICIAFSALRNRRGLLNASLTFAAIHGYTQAFENFGAHPLIFALGGIIAIPLAWGLYRLNRRLAP